MKYKVYALILLASFATLNANVTKPETTPLEESEETVLVSVKKEDLQAAVKMAQEVLEIAMQGAEEEVAEEEVVPEEE